MFFDREITPELEQELQRQEIILGHSRHEVCEAWEKIRSIPMEGFRGNGVTNAAYEINDILKKWKGPDTSWEALGGLKVLDLASGSGFSFDMLGHCWYPHFSRLCSINGADVFAIDGRPQRDLDQSMFKWTTENLVDVVYAGGLQSLPFIQGNRFDIIHSTNFINDNSSRELRNDLIYRKKGLFDFEEKIFQQAGELLAEGGVMFLDHKDRDFSPILFTKKAGNIIQLAS